MTKAERRRRTINARNRAIDAAWGDKPEPMHTRAVFRTTAPTAIAMGLMPKRSRTTEPPVEEDNGCTVTALEYIPRLQDRKKNLAAPTVAARSSEQVHEARKRMGGLDKNFDTLVERSNW